MIDLLGPACTNLQVINLSYPWSTYCWLNLCHTSVMHNKCLIYITIILLVLIGRERTEWQTLEKSKRWQYSPTVLEGQEGFQKCTGCQAIFQTFCAELCQGVERQISVWDPPRIISYHLSKCFKIIFILFWFMRLDFYYFDSFGDGIFGVVKG